MDRKGKIAPDVKNILNYTNKNWSETIKKNGGAMVEAVIDAEQKNKEKADNIKVSWILLILGLVIVIIFLFIFALSGAAQRNDAN